MKNERKNLKRNQLISFGITLIVIVVANIIASFVYTRIDLTSEKRYSLSETSKEILRNLDDYVYFRVYLEGDFPAGFKKLRKETMEMLDEMPENHGVVRLRGGILHDGNDVGCEIRRCVRLADRLEAS